MPFFKFRTFLHPGADVAQASEGQWLIEQGFKSILLVLDGPLPARQRCAAKIWSKQIDEVDRRLRVDEADLHDGVQKLQKARAASGVRFEYYLKGPLDSLFQE